MHCCHSPSTIKSGREVCFGQVHEGLTAVKDKPIDSDRLVLNNTDVLDQLLFVAHRTKRRHQPAVTIMALAYIRCRRPIDKELRLLKNFLSQIVNKGAFNHGSRKELEEKPTETRFTPRGLISSFF